MNITSRFCLGVFLLIGASFSFAASSVTCTPVTLTEQNKSIILPGVEGSHATMIYFFNNKAQKSIWIDHPTDKGSASTSWNSYLRPGNWSALLINRKNFALTCGEIKPGKFNLQSCPQVISVCIPAASYESKRKGTYWLAEDQSWDELTKNLDKRGVHFKKP